MNNQIIATGGATTSLSFMQTRELAKIEQSALLSAAVEVADHRRRLLIAETVNVERLVGIRHTEELGRAAIKAASNVIDTAIDAVGDSEFKSHHISKIVDRVTTRLAEQA